MAITARDKAVKRHLRKSLLKSRWEKFRWEEYFYWQRWRAEGRREWRALFASIGPGHWHER